MLLAHKPLHFDHMQKYCSFETVPSHLEVHFRATFLKLSLSILQRVTRFWKWNKISFFMSAFHFFNINVFYLTAIAEWMYFCMNGSSPSICPFQHLLPQVISRRYVLVITTVLCLLSLPLIIYISPTYYFSISDPNFVSTAFSSCII